MIRDVQSVGNHVLGDKDIRDITGALVGSPVSPDTIQRYAKRIEQAYREKGYYNAQVSPDQPALTSRGVLVFRVREGQKTTIADVRFEGNLTFTPRELRQDLKSTASTLFSRAPLNDDDLTADVAVLANYYRDRGYFDARVDRIVQVSPDGREAIVTFVISEGPVYTLRSVVAVYAPGDEHVLSPEQIMGLMVLRPGDVYGKRHRDRSIEAVRNAYGTMGYVDMQLEAHELRDADRPLIDLRLDIAEGSRFFTGEVNISGNEITQQKVIRREVRVAPGRPLDLNAARETEDRLEQTRLFLPKSPRVTIQPVNDMDPSFRDVLVEVKETNTGNFNIGGVLSSDGGLTALVSTTERNFDVTDYPRTLGQLAPGQSFRGAGQTFNAQLAPGTKSQTFGLGLAEPALFESAFSGSANGSARRDALRQYDQFQYGANLSLSRRFGSRWEGSFPLRFQWTELENFADASAEDYHRDAGLRLLTGLGASLSRNTFDNRMRPTRGTLTKLSIEQVGVLGGDFDFTAIHADHKVFVPVLEDILGRRTVLQVSSKLSYIPQGPGDTPVYERFMLGGQSLRGFDYRGVSPRGIRHDNGQLGTDPVGGNFSFFLGAELQQPLYEDVLALALFVDSGTVNQRFSFADYRVSAGVGFRVIIPGLSPVPLAFDLGFPLRKQPEDGTRFFTFSIDIPFK